MDWASAAYAAAALVCAAAATVVALGHIYRHLLHYAEPVYQRFIVRIIFMVPVYSVMSFLSLIFPDSAIVFNSIREMFTVLEKSSNQVLVKNRKKEIVKKSPLPIATDAIVWSSDMESVALLSKHAVVIASKNLVHRCTLHETIRVKSGPWMRSCDHFQARPPSETL